MQTIATSSIRFLVLSVCVAALGQSDWLGNLGRVVADDTAKPGMKQVVSHVLSENSAKPSIPAEILARARAEGFSASDVKLEGDQWIACKPANGASGGVCITLGTLAVRKAQPKPTSVAFSRLVAGDTLVIEQYGQPLRRSQLTSSQVRSTANILPVENIGAFERIDPNAFRFVLFGNSEARVSLSGRPDEVVDTLPRYRREADGVVRTKDHTLVKEYIDSHPGESFIVLVTVPTLCEPCRQMDHLLTQADKRASSMNMSLSSKPKLFILEYFSFVDAERDVLGRGALFPTTLIYPATAQPRRSLARMIGDSRGKSIAEVAAPLQGWLKRGMPHTLTRGVVNPDTLYTLAQ